MCEMKSSKFRAKRVQEEEDEEILPQAKIGVDLIKKPTIFFVQNILASRNWKQLTEDCRSSVHFELIFNTRVDVMNKF